MFAIKTILAVRSTAKRANDLFQYRIGLDSLIETRNILDIHLDHVMEVFGDGAVDIPLTMCSGVTADVAGARF